MFQIYHQTSATRNMSTRGSVKMTHNGEQRFLPATVTNLKTFEIFDKIPVKSKIGEHLKQLYLPDHKIQNVPNKSIFNKIHRLKVLRNSFIRNRKHKEAQELEEKEFNITDKLNFIEDMNTVRVVNQVQQRVREVVNENASLKRKLHDAESAYKTLEDEEEIVVKRLQETYMEMKSVLESSSQDKSELQKKLSDLEKSYKDATDELDTVNQKLAEAQTKMGSSSVRNLNKKIKRRDSALKNLKTEVNFQKAELKSVNENLKNTCEDLDVVNQKLSENKKRKGEIAKANNLSQKKGK